MSKLKFLSRSDVASDIPGTDALLKGISMKHPVKEGINNINAGSEANKIGRNAKLYTRDAIESRSLPLTCMHASLMIAVFSLYLPLGNSTFLLLSLNLSQLLLVLPLGAILVGRGLIGSLVHLAWTDCNKVLPRGTTDPNPTVLSLSLVRQANTIHPHPQSESVCPSGKC